MNPLYHMTCMSLFLTWHLCSQIWWLTWTLYIMWHVCPSVLYDTCVRRFDGWRQQSIVHNMYAPLYCMTCMSTDLMAGVNPPYYMTYMSTDLMADVSPPYYMTCMSTNLMGDVNPLYYMTCVSTGLLVNVNTTSNTLLLTCTCNTSDDVKLQQLHTNRIDPYVAEVSLAWINSNNKVTMVSSLRRSSKELAIHPWK